MPTFILFARGREVARTSGADLEKIKAMLQKATYGGGEGCLARVPIFRGLMLRDVGCFFAFKGAAFSLFLLFPSLSLVPVS